MNEALKKLAATYAALHYASFARDDSDDDAWTLLRGKRGGGSTPQIEVRREGVYRLLERFENDVEHLAERYLRYLDKELNGRD